MQFIGLTILGLVGMEIFSYIAHRWFFHGILWKIHQTHHVAGKDTFEANDIFSTVFALGSIGLMIFAEKPFTESNSFPIGLGIAVYGFAYFIAHDIFTHRRFLSLRTENNILLVIRTAHQRHHQTTEKIGVEPFGLFFFPYEMFRKKISNKRKVKI